MADRLTMLIGGAFGRNSFEYFHDERRGRGICLGQEVAACKIRWKFERSLNTGNDSSQTYRAISNKSNFIVGIYPAPCTIAPAGHVIPVFSRF